MLGGYFFDLSELFEQLEYLKLQQADHLCNSIGILQQFSTPSKFPGFERSTASGGIQQQSPAGPGGQPIEEYIQLFTQLITRTAKDIDGLIDSLPNEENSVDMQVTSLRHLELENQEAADNLNLEVRKGQYLLEQIQDALSEISQAQLDMQKIEW